MAKSVLINQSIWQSRVFSTIRERAANAPEPEKTDAAHNAQQTLLLANYLITNGGGNALGLYGLDMEVAAEAMLIEPWAVEDHLRVLADLDFLTYDRRLFDAGHLRKHPFVWLHSMVKYQFDLLDARKTMAPGDRRVIGIRKQLEACPARTLVELFVSRYNTKCALNFDLSTARNELAIREDAAAHLIGPPLELLRSQGVR